MGLPGVPAYADWLAQELDAGAVVGFDGNVFSVTQVKKLDRAFKDQAVSFAFETDLGAEIWTDRPAVPKNEIFEHELKFAGEPRTSKIERIRERMSAQGVDVHLVSTLDDIAWTLNIRGSDVAFNPVAISYLVIAQQEVRLFIDPDKVPAQLRDALEKDGVVLADTTMRF